MKICLTCSPGGHLLQILQLKKVYDKHDHFFLTFKELTTKNLGKKSRYYIAPPPPAAPESVEAEAEN